MDEIEAFKIKNLMLQARYEQLDKMYRSLLEEIFSIQNENQRKQNFTVIKGGKLTGPTRSGADI